MPPVAVRPPGPPIGRARRDLAHQLLSLPPPPNEPPPLSKPLLDELELSELELELSNAADDDASLLEFGRVASLS